MGPFRSDAETVRDVLQHPVWLAEIVIWLSFIIQQLGSMASVVGDPTNLWVRGIGEEVFAAREEHHEGGDVADALCVVVEGGKDGAGELTSIRNVLAPPNNEALFQLDAMLLG